MFGFWEGRKAQELQEKPSEQGHETNNKLNPHVTPGLGFEPEPQKWFDHRF